MATVEKQDTDLVTIEVDGREVEARKGEMIIEATDRADIEIPRFCYHHKLSIAANCRMCLVDVEKAPKPLPACATPVADGMKVYTRSKRARDAQRGVMEFLLINHPLDCPICDQGGECELQDLAMGYGRSISRFTERKRVVKDKNLGPLVSTDMTRCIHCTRCIRFLEQIAGTAELGGVGRGEHLEISTFIERNIDSELSGNIIDLCPVGALTNKPFRFSARAWEMSARPYVGTHDCVGSNLYYHTYLGRIMRAVPRENEAVNECWLADRDRYSHFGLGADDRVTRPRIKVDGQWQDTDWQTALERAAGLLRGVVDAHGADQVGVLASPRATCEEHFLLRHLADRLGTPHVDHRLRIADTGDARLGRAALDRPTQEIAAADAVFLVGSHLRHDQPILNHRVRTAWRTNNAAVMDLNPVAWKFPFDFTERMIEAPQHLPESLARVAKAAFDLKGASPGDDVLGRFIAERSPEHAARTIAEKLDAADNGFLILGDQALFHPEAGHIRALAERISEALEVALIVLPGPANSEGAWQAGAVPGEGGWPAARQLADGRKGFVLFDLEPEFDTANPADARRALGEADVVIALTTFAGTDLLETADVLLPLAPVPETDGSYVNADGRRQWLKAAGKPPENVREGWKILRVLGGELGLDGFDFSLLAEVNQMMDEAGPRDAAPGEIGRIAAPGEAGLWRTGPVPIYAGDALVRRAAALQDTHHAETGFAAINASTAKSLGLADGDEAVVVQDGSEARVPVRIDNAVPPSSVWLPSATCIGSRLGSAFGPIEINKA
ncbi:MAG: NADH-quinone oxidoreductase subunit NuoG [Wenzhouxiangellaceae bacterium]|nr:NADH-quinone oxidoreductase subunit NuoG [Wenzhouxiangellaceae bacterium]